MTMARICMQVTFDERETTHRIICGHQFYETLNLEPETVVERVFSFLLAKKIPRHTEGMPLYHCHRAWNTPSESGGLWCS